jgi:hypothetical protein
MIPSMPVSSRVSPLIIYEKPTMEDPDEPKTHIKLSFLGSHYFHCFIRLIEMAVTVKVFRQEFFLPDIGRSDSSCTM